MATSSNIHISPELEQALKGYVPKCQYNVALQALAEAEGDKEALEQELERMRETARRFYFQKETLKNKKLKLEQEKEELEIRLGLRSAGSRLLRRDYMASIDLEKLEEDRKIASSP